MSKRMSKTILGLIKKARKYIIAKALYFIRDTHSTKKESKRAVARGPSRPTQGMLERAYQEKGKKSMFNQYTSLTTIGKEILNQIEDQNLLKRPNPIKFDSCKWDSTKYNKFYKDHGHNIKDFF